MGEEIEGFHGGSLEAKDLKGNVWRMQNVRMKVADLWTWLT
jgi:hypothetical protein